MWTECCQHHITTKSQQSQTQGPGNEATLLGPSSYAPSMLLYFVYIYCLVTASQYLYSNTMHRNATALAGLFTAVISLQTRPKAVKTRRQRLFELIGMLIYILRRKSRATRFLLPSLRRHFGPRGPYDIEKSNTLRIMRKHRNNVWFRQFFRCVYALNDTFCALPNTPTVAAGVASRHSLN